MTRETDLVGIIGAGPFGLALAAMLGRVGRRAMLWSKNAEVVDEINKGHRSERFPGLDLSEHVYATSDVAELAERTRFLVLAVSSQDVRNRLHDLGAAADGSHIAVHALGALTSPDDKRVTEVIAEETPILRTGVIAGPSMAADIAAGRGTSLVCASEFDEVTSECRRLLSVPPTMRLYRGRDVIGAELASALSGAYTISLGMADRLKVGIGTRAVLVTRAVSEMARLGEAAGAQAKTFHGLAGLGNLLVRSSIEGEHQSPSYRLGRTLAENDGRGSLEPGARAARAGARLARKYGLDLPILSTTVRVLDGEMKASDAAENILARVAEEE